MSNLLFAYGTLLPGRAPGEIAAVVNRLRPVERGFVRGTLYDLGDYPGAVLDPTSPRMIVGTVLQLPDDAGFLHQLDAYEGFDPNAPEESLFLRVRHPVTVASGRTLQCWVYVYNRAPLRARIVAGGTFQSDQFESKTAARTPE
jgi:gamma-glutamylcyclotransferase (GGCT)/AIG2-like uncharacterized protein YtfP